MTSGKHIPGLRQYKSCVVEMVAVGSVWVFVPVLDFM